MNPETIITELRLYNRWRRGDEAITAPDPTALGKLLDAAAESLCSLIASNTTLRRERSEARAEVAQLKGALSLGQENCDAEYEALREERDEAKADLARMEEYLRNSGRNMDEAQEQIAERDANLTNLRARVAELEEKAQKFPWELAGKAKRLEQRNAELAGALRNIIEIVREDGSDEGYDRAIAREAEIALDPSLARNAAGGPAKHPDTEIIDRFEEMCGSLEYCDADDMPSHWRAYGYAGSHERAGSSLRDALRAAIAAARKQGGAA